ncbi:hypothetical protein ACIS_00938 [Anaplasma centrale str. Israel]|uniref:Uncharacterized protein n=1 Tax=Anaplasma centrale (strain Israel) TaxID=574556 RepID=D1ASJ2_ANACI|nr:hypothetical protein [Anaplasma centrale]ACZ49445.1 hypothetical protein ACIS_00938 [Anaplasma centrale str. Israel]
MLSVVGGRGSAVRLLALLPGREKKSAAQPRQGAAGSGSNCSTTSSNLPDNEQAQNGSASPSEQNEGCTHATHGAVGSVGSFFSDSVANSREDVRDDTLPSSGSAELAATAPTLKTRVDQKMRDAAPEPWSLICASTHDSCGISSIPQNDIREFCRKYLYQKPKDRQGLINFIRASITNISTTSIISVASTEKASMRTIHSSSDDSIAGMKVTEQHTFYVQSSANGHIHVLVADIEYKVRPTSTQNRYKICDLSIEIRRDGVNTRLLYSCNGTSEVSLPITRAAHRGAQNATSDTHSDASDSCGAGGELITPDVVAETQKPSSAHAAEAGQEQGESGVSEASGNAHAETPRARGSEIRRESLTSTDEEHQHDQPLFADTIAQAVLQTAGRRGSASSTDGSVTETFRQRAYESFPDYGVQHTLAPETLQSSDQSGTANATVAASLWSGTEFTLAKDVEEILCDEHFVQNLFFAQQGEASSFAKKLILGIFEKLAKRSLPDSDFKIEDEVLSRSRLKKEGSYRVTHKATMVRTRDREEAEKMRVHLRYTVRLNPTTDKPSVPGTHREQVQCLNTEDMASNSSIPPADAQNLHDNSMRGGCNKSKPASAQEEEARSLLAKIFCRVYAAFRAILRTIWKFIVYPFTLLVSRISPNRNSSNITSDDVVVTEKSPGSQIHSSSRGSHAHRSQHEVAEGMREKRNPATGHSDLERKGRTDSGSPSTAMSDVEVNSLRSHANLRSA